MTLQIPIDKQSKIFKEHLEDPKNERIIFSGIFGIGKSYFLNKYFDDKKDKYVVVNLRPINYSISNNEDIFQLIKYDILYELIMTHNLKLIVESVSRSIAYGTLFEEKAVGLMESFISLIPLLNKEIPDVSSLVSFIKKLVPNIIEIENRRKDINLNSKLLDFVKGVDQTFLLESDFITEFIEKSLDYLAVKDEKDEKYKILIIDDLDRIDPEHIFRLFNIFSAHFDYHKTSTNKFGFDKVIFVCDIDNIRNIFNAKYGINVDFSGYIDKFYSTEIFFFNNNEEVASFTNKIIKNISFGTYQPIIKKYILHDDEESKTNLLYILLKACIDSGALNMRRIQAIYNSEFKLVQRQIFFRNYEPIYNKNVPATIVFDIVSWIFGDIKSLERALQRLVNFGRSGKQVEEIQYNANISTYLRMLIPIIDNANHKFEVKDNISNFPAEIKLEAKINSNIVNLKYRLKISNPSSFSIFYADMEDSNNKENTQVELFEFVLEAFNTLKAINYF